MLLSRLLLLYPYLRPTSPFERQRSSAAPMLTWCAWQEAEPGFAISWIAARANISPSMAILWKPMRRREPHATGAVGGSGAGPSHRATDRVTICAGTGIAEPGGTGAWGKTRCATTDPDSTYATKGGTPARLRYCDNHLVDNRRCVIVGVQATAARRSQETTAAKVIGTTPLRRPSSALPTIASLPRQRYSNDALAVSRLLNSSQYFARNCCSVCATKGGAMDGTTICGVLLLDPSRHSPLELVKSVGDVLVRGRHRTTASNDYDQREPWQLTASINRRARDLQRTPASANRVRGPHRSAYEGVILLKLKKLQILGFKSFCDRTELKFHGEGIAAIIGPNGCGKSNIADAISWVLGEQSAKTLRGARMEDVIFAGTRDRIPTGMAEVSLTLIDPEVYGGADSSAPTEIEIQDDLIEENWDEAGLRAQAAVETERAVEEAQPGQTEEVEAPAESAVVGGVATAASADDAAAANSTEDE